MIEKKIFEPWPKQREFINEVLSDKYSFACYGGAMGGGKTFVSLSILVLLCKLFPGSVWCVIRKSIPRLTDTTMPSFKKICPDNFLKKLYTKPYNAVFKNGSEIWFRAEDYQSDKDFDKFKGMEVNGFLLEQIEELQEQLLPICFTRAGRNKINPMPKPLIMATVNPTLTWPKKVIYKPYISEKLPADWLYMPALISDNPALYEDENFMKQLENLDDVTYARFVDGDWSAFKVERQFMYSFDEKKHVCKDIWFRDDLPIYLSFDFNVDPITCIASQHSSNKNWSRTIMEFRIRNSDISELCDKITGTLGLLDYNFIVNGDASGQSRTALMKNINYYKIIQQKLRINANYFHITAKNPEISNSRVLSNSLLSRHPDMKICERCEFLINDLKSVECLPDGSIDKSTGTLTHLLDCYRYYHWMNFSEFIKIVR